MQFNRVVNQASSAKGNGDFGMRKQLLNCLDIQKVGNFLISLLSNSNTSDHARTVSVTAEQWKGWAASSKVTGNFSRDFADDVKDGYDGLVQGCESWVGGLKHDLMYAAYAVAAIVALLIIYCSIKKLRENNCSFGRLFSGNNQRYMMVGPDPLDDEKQDYSNDV